MSKNVLLSVDLTIDDKLSSVFDAEPEWKATIQAALAFNSGLGAGQFDLAYVAERTVADGSADDIDLSGILTNAFGDVIEGFQVALIAVINKPKNPTLSNTTDLTIGGGSTPYVGFLGGTTPTIGPIKPGGVFLIGADDIHGVGAFSAGLSDVLRITNSAGADASYQIAILARSHVAPQISFGPNSGTNDTSPRRKKGSVFNVSGGDVLVTSIAFSTSQNQQMEMIIARLNEDDEIEEFIADTGDLRFVATSGVNNVDLTGLPDDGALFEDGETYAVFMNMGFAPANVYIHELIASDPLWTDPNGIINVTDQKQVYSTTDATLLGADYVSAGGAEPYCFRFTYTPLA